ncbi:Transcriptional regulator, IclR family [Olavius sp. associated proteobacterium Delta 1]|nr:Transcriptional regulator, IclR family [Olavius sp. associated proteobacterium Delta 1]
MKLPGTNNSIYRVQALERALDILDCFNFQNRELSLSDVVNRTGLNKTTAKRLISNLTTRGYLQHDPQTRKYQLGMRLFELGGVVFSSFSLRRAASSPMTGLQNETGATVLLGVRMEDQLVYVDKREGDGMIRISSDVGWRRPLHYGMLGMVLMANIESKEVDRILEKYPLEAHTPFSITDFDAFSLRLEEIRVQGSVVEKEEAVEGLFGIAAPIKDYSRQVVAALGIALPVGQRNLKEGLNHTIDLVKKTCDLISSDLGYLKI